MTRTLDQMHSRLLERAVAELDRQPIQPLAEAADEIPPNTSGVARLFCGNKLHSNISTVDLRDELRKKLVNQAQVHRCAHPLATAVKLHLNCHQPGFATKTGANSHLFGIKRDS